MGAIRATRPDLVVLDIMLPRLDGFSVLREMRRIVDVPVILLSARAEETDRVLGLELGADDYVVKPFSPRELAARVRSVLRRARPVAPVARLEFDGLVIDGVMRETLVRGEPVELTPKEFDLLAFLAAAPRQVFSRGPASRAGVGLLTRVPECIDGDGACPSYQAEDRGRPR